MNEESLGIIAGIFLIALLGFGSYGCQWSMHSIFEKEDNSFLVEQSRITGRIRDKYSDDGKYYVYVGWSAFEVSEEDYNKVDTGDIVEIVTKYWSRDDLNSMFDDIEAPFNAIEQVFKRNQL